MPNISRRRRSSALCDAALCLVLALTGCEQNPDESRGPTSEPSVVGDTDHVILSASAQLGGIVDNPQHVVAITQVLNSEDAPIATLRSKTSEDDRGLWTVYVDRDSSTISIAPDYKSAQLRGVVVAESCWSYEGVDLSKDDRCNIGESVAVSATWTASEPTTIFPTATRQGELSAERLFAEGRVGRATVCIREACTDAIYAEIVKSSHSVSFEHEQSLGSGR